MLLDPASRCLIPVQDVVDMAMLLIRSDPRVESLVRLHLRKRPKRKVSTANPTSESTCENAALLRLRKPGRPRTTSDSKPWIAAGVSRRTWYRRLKENPE